MNKISKTILSITIILIILALAGYYIVKNLSSFEQIKLVNPLWFIPLVALLLINYFFIGVQTKVLIEPLGVKLKNMEAYMLSIVNGFYNLITPARGGMVVKAIYLNKKHQFSYSNFFSSLAGMYVITFFVGSLLGIISLLCISAIYGFFNWIILALLLCLFLPLLWIIVFTPEFKETKYKFINYFIKVANGWNLIRKEKKIVKTCILVTIYSLISGTISLIISYYIFGIHLSIINALFLASISSIAILIHLTPAGLGINEAIIVFSSLAIGITPVQSISVAILSRVVQIIPLFTLGPIFSYKLLKHNPKNESQNPINSKK